MSEIRQYEDSTDRAQVSELWRTVFGYEATHNEPALSISKKFANRDDLFFVATAGPKVSGTVMAGYDGHRGRLYAAAVHPDLRRSGLGSRLVQFAENALTAVGCMKVNLQLLASNQATADFYKSLGYTVEPRVSMGKILHGNLTPSVCGRVTDC
jgi:ribosomal protein S18 acetylase RimI-like enzyme